MGDSTAAERIARFREKRLKDGLVEVRVWVHPDVVPLIKDVAKYVPPDPDIIQILRDGVQSVCADAGPPPPPAAASTPAAPAARSPARATPKPDGPTTKKASKNYSPAAYPVPVIVRYVQKPPSDHRKDLRHQWDLRWNGEMWEGLISGGISLRDLSYNALLNGGVVFVVEPGKPRVEIHPDWDNVLLPVYDEDGHRLN